MQIDATNIKTCLCCSRAKAFVIDAACHVDYEDLNIVCQLKPKGDHSIDYAETCPNYSNVFKRIIQLTKVRQEKIQWPESV